MRIGVGGLGESVKVFKNMLGFRPQCTVFRDNGYVESHVVSII